MIKSTIVSPQGLLLIWLKVWLVALSGGCSPPLSYADQRLCCHTPRNSPTQGLQAQPQ